MSELNTDIMYLSGVGPKRAELLKKELGIQTLGDLIHLYPYRYIDRSGVQKIADAAALASTSASLQIRAKIIRKTLYGPGNTTLNPETTKINFNSAKRLSLIVADDSGEMEMVFFKGIKWNYQRLQPGMVFIFFGKPQEFNGRYNMIHPEVDAPQDGNMGQGVMTGVYPSTEKLKNAGITGKAMCKMQSAALSLCLPEITETLPQYVIEENGLCPLPYALKNIHFPTDSYALSKANNRLKFEELFLLQLSLLKQKFVRSRAEQGIPMPKVGPDFNACFESLPYKLTGAQQRVIKEIRSDLMSGRQMNRLLQGDVGSGKTMVAVMSCLLAIGNGYQTCIMAPTEVLAQQHFHNISKYLKPTGVKAALLTGSVGAKQRREIHAGLADGSIGILVGTHALIEDSVVFARLGLAVIDEQHRFGVDQRAKLWAKGPGGIAPHILVMTATPIPRTLAMTVYGDLDVSVIDELPPGRKPVRTMQIGPQRKPAMYKFMRDQIALGRQVFVVFPMIFENEKLDYENLEKGYEDIIERFPLKDGYKIAIVHGQQSSAEKEFNMDAFAAGRANILVSTTVIEVGVDVPNASVMVIESAQRFGLSQLHQLRGRVGRGADEAYCILVKDYKVSKESAQRLDLMCRTQDGFEIAEEDMKMRGPGDLEGTQQSGLPVALNIASLLRDTSILTAARGYAEAVLKADPMLSSERNRLLVMALRAEKYCPKDYSSIS